MKITSGALHDALKDFFGFDHFKDRQEEIILNLLDKKDTLVIMPTGGGKSLCYQLPALITEGTALIISPLIALMKNQVDSIRGYGQKDSVAHFLNSSLSKTQIKQVKEDIMSGETKMLFVAPETLTKEENIKFFRETNVSFVAVDEAHCISEWGHDFRPEYRRIREMIQGIGSNIPLIALTATATPKVKSDISKNLAMQEVKEFISSFNRTNLYYEVRPKITKEQTIKEIVQIIKKQPGQSGIIYVQSRKSTEAIAQVLQVNGINAAAYHAGLDAKTRSKVQDDFLMEQCDVIVATIAFGMGIDKPDVRFVIHYDIPKSIENYYQETGRAGRDGLIGNCIAFYAHKDILRLEKFLKDKPLSERELSAQLMEEVIAYSETSQCRRVFLLHYFGETFAKEDCAGKCDNCSNPKEKMEAGPELKKAIGIIKELNENYGIKFLVEYLAGRKTQEMKNFKYDIKKSFGSGSDHDGLFWHSLMRQGMLAGYIRKDIELYGLVKTTKNGLDFLKNGKSFEISINHDYSFNSSEVAVVTETGTGAALDQSLVELLKDIRLSEAKKIGIKPWIIFMDPSLIDMATYYPISIEDMLNISGVSKGKAIKYGAPFIEAIKEYVEEHEIERPTDFIVKQLANKSKAKVAIIQGVDRKMPLEDIAKDNDMSMEALILEMEMIVGAGTKLNINYYLEDNIDEDIVEEIFEYFEEAESESIEDAVSEFSDDDITEQEVQLVRIKFLSEVVN
ncbi:MAG: ATP-dependent DNA helicase RecQ [Saprospiraceae bacterium]|jgi:ATP-dependent DNA helicase RecQ